jgi:hypothetical protein
MKRKLAELILDNPQLSVIVFTSDEVSTADIHSGFINEAYIDCVADTPDGYVRQEDKERFFDMFREIGRSEKEIEATWQRLSWEKCIVVNVGL